VSEGMMRRWGTLCLLAIMVGTVIMRPLPLRAQKEEITRKVKTRVQPVYPDIARRMNIAGVVKVQVVVAPNGNVKSAKLVGGHPLLANSAMDAVRKWRFESGSEDTTGVVEFKFETPQ
jgi:TonB family protein